MKVSDTPYNREEISARTLPRSSKAIERHFPVMPYVRESRRLIGVHTLTAADNRREGVTPEASRAFGESIALGTIRSICTGAPRSDA